MSNEFVLFQVHRFQQPFLGHNFRPNFRGAFRLPEKKQRVDLFSHNWQQITPGVTNDKQLVQTMAQACKDRNQLWIAGNRCGGFFNDHKTIAGPPSNVPKCFLICGQITYCVLWPFPPLVYVRIKDQRFPAFRFENLCAKSAGKGCLARQLGTERAAVCHADNAPLRLRNKPVIEDQTLLNFGLIHK